jgi:hypothetical protein
VRSDLGFQRLYEFLSRLRKEFEPRCLPMVVFSFQRCCLSFVLRTRLRGARLLDVTSMLANRGPPSSSPTPSTPLLRHFNPLLRVRARVVARGVALAPVLIVPTVTWMVIVSLIATRGTVIYDACFF